MKLKCLLFWAIFATSPLLSVADDARNAPAGVLPTAPIGPPPCLQSGAIGGPNDPCSYKLHHLTPEEVTIQKGGQVTFQIHGGGHGFAIYPVSSNTTRDGLGQFLCAGLDPETIADPANHVCNLSALNANAAHNVVDGKGRVVYAVAPNITNAHPDNRVWAEPGRLTSAGAQQFLNGGTIPAGATSNGQLITYRFMKTGRYVVLCMNRTHHLNDWMFGFVNVTDKDSD
jgi:plastocyanin